MVAANQFDLINSFTIDPMHCLHLGVMKHLLNLWLDTTNKSKPFFINKRQQVVLSNRLVNIKPVSEITRQPKSIFKRGEYKANEYRSLLLYYLPVSLNGLLSNRYIEHFRLLSSGTYMLYKAKISYEEIEQSQLMLTRFADEFEDLYGKSNVTMNVHLTRHIATTVENLGPLWAQSAYAFEANNGVISKSNTFTKDILHQLAWKYTGSRH